MVSGGEDAGCEGGTEGAGFDDEGRDVEGGEFVGEGFVDGFDGEFASGVGGAAGAGDEAVYFVVNIITVRIFFVLFFLRLEKAFFVVFFFFSLFRSINRVCFMREMLGHA